MFPILSRLASNRILLWSCAVGLAASACSSDSGTSTDQSGGATVAGWAGALTNVGGAQPGYGGQAAGGRAGATNFGGSSFGGAVAGTSGQLNGGNSMGGASNGGSAMGGTTSGGSSMGGTTSGGRSMGGATSGGSSMGGATSGGSSMGGATSGGSSMGGAAGCTVPPDPSPLVGWASVSGNGTNTTTGGGNETPITVNSLSALQNAVSGTNAAVVYVTGSLDPGNLSVGSNKTIVGLCGAEIHGHIEMSGSVNVIVRNITIVGYGSGDCALDPSYDSAEGCSSGSDAISVQKNAHHIWFDHCDISDGTDGNLDITNAANYVTVSFTRFHYKPRTDNQGSDSTGSSGHRYSNLVGGTDNPSSYDDANALNVTWHHDWWADNVVERMPRVRFGQNHVYNCLFTSSTANYCIRAGKGARILLEGNYFQGVSDPHEFNSDADRGTAYITADSSNFYDSSTSGTKDTGGDGTPFTDPPYQYSLEDAAAARTAIMNGAGPQ